jgi:hypothetical protein
MTAAGKSCKKNRGLEACYRLYLSAEIQRNMTIGQAIWNLAVAWSVLYILALSRTLARPQEDFTDAWQRLLP